MFNKRLGPKTSHPFPATDFLTNKEEIEKMINQQVLQGNWNEIKGKLRSKWSELTEEDVKAFNGNVDQLLGKIQNKTGVARESIEQFFEQFNANASSAFSQVKDSVVGAAQHAASSAQEATQHAAASMRSGYAEVEGVVRRHPTETLVACFGAGILTGVVVSLFLRSR
ncbi:MAG: CsbD family protein [Pirellula sp.]|jgi:uncharacterized protein YjbJ (UPF0337 family)|nr:CsbD family protein [Pirellula sp.]